VVSLMKKGKKGKKENIVAPDDLVTVKIKRSTKRELTKTKNLMGFYSERNVSYDEVIRALMEIAPKSKFTMVPESEENRENGNGS